MSTLPGSPPPNLSELLMRIRYDATAIQAKVTDLLSLVNSLGLDEKPLRVPRPNGPVTAAGCPGCGCGDGLHALDCTAPRSGANEYEFESGVAGG